MSKETERSSDLKSKLTESRSAISKLEASIAESQAESNCLKKEINYIRTDKEKLACQLADISGSAIASTQTLTSKNESLQKMVSVCKNKDILLQLYHVAISHIVNKLYLVPLYSQVNVLETDVSRKKSRIEELEEKLSTIEKDYDNYKVHEL